MSKPSMLPTHLASLQKVINLYVAYQRMDFKTYSDLLMTYSQLIRKYVNYPTFQKIYCGMVSQAKVIRAIRELEIACHVENHS